MQSLDLDKVIALAAGDFRRHFMRLAPAFLLIAVTVNAINALIMKHMFEAGDPTRIAFGPLLLIICISFLAFGIDLVLADNVMRQGKLNAGGAVLRVLQRLPTLLVTVLAFYLAFSIGIVLLIVPGLIALVTLGFAWYLVLLDDAGPVDALRGSFRLVWGNAWSVFAANLLWGVGYGLMVVAMLALFPGSFQEAAVVLSEGLTYADWRRWLIDVVGVMGGCAYLFLNLRILEELKRLKSDTAVATPAQAGLTA